MSDNYILDGRKVVKCDNFINWAAYFGQADRNIAKTQLDNCQVSTVFLGIDHSFGMGSPMLFETMIFGGEYNEYTWRYSTYAQAEIGHQHVVRSIEKGQEPGRQPTEFYFTVSELLDYIFE
jgi:hypothetical protein